MLDELLLVFWVLRNCSLSTLTLSLSDTMMTATGPPPSPPLSTEPADSETLDNVPMENTSHSSTQMKPPPPKNPSPSPPQNPNPTPPSTSTTDSETAPPKTSKHQSQSFAVPYSIPEWSGAPCHQFQLEVLKDGAIVDQFNVYEKGAYMFGRVDLCDFVLEHPTISRFHAVLQFKRSGDAYIYDLGSTHGTFVNKNQVSMNFSHDMDHEYEKICRRMNPPSLDGLKRQSNLKYGVEVVKSDEQVHLVKRKSKCKLSKLN